MKLRLWTCEAMKIAAWAKSPGEAVVIWDKAGHTVTDTVREADDWSAFALRAAGWPIYFFSALGKVKK